MQFLKRFSNSLFAPKEIINYKNDKWYITLLFFLILVFLLSVPQVVLSLQQDEMSYEEKKEIRLNFQGEDDIPFEIINGVLIHDSNDSNYVYKNKVTRNINVIITTGEEIDSNLIDTNMSIVFRTDGVYLLQSVVHTKLLDYDDYEQLNGLDFSEASNSTNVSFWDRIFDVTNQKIKEIKPLLNFVAIFATFITSIIDLIFIALVLSLFQLFLLSKVIPFRKIFKLCIYLLTPYTFGSVLALLFNMGILYYIGFLMTAIYVARLTRTIIGQSMRRS